MQEFLRKVSQLKSPRWRVSGPGSHVRVQVSDPGFQVKSLRSRVQLFWYAEMQLGYQKSEQNIVKRETKI